MHKRQESTPYAVTLVTLSEHIKPFQGREGTEAYS